MCGIVGMIGTKNRKIENSSKIFEMMDAQIHRGPNDSGAVTFDYAENVGHTLFERENRLCDGVLGFNRLSILDTSAAGHQPMFSPNQDVILIFNGEIYNAFELKNIYSLYSFKSKTDTEVILALYLKYGFAKTIGMLNGMFSICLVDLRINKVFLVRDRFGIKPLYWTYQNNILYFASEYKSFLDLDLSFHLDAMAVSEYFNFRSCISRTMAKEVHQITPGTYLCVSENEVSSYKYFDINQYREKHILLSKDELEDKLEFLLTQAVQRQLISDVPLGCQLSGGIDSSLISALVKLEVGNSVDSISILFDDIRFTEKPWIDYVGKMLQLNQHNITFGNDVDFISLMEKCVWHEEGVLTHPNSLGIYLLSESARKYVTVLLSGEGADECFAGYTRFALGDGQTNSYNDWIRRTTTIPSDLRKAIFPDIQDDFIECERIDLIKGLSGSFFDKKRKYEFMTYLPELLIRQDKMSMANSIENRVPFLDNDLVEFAFSLSEDQLIKENSGKIITKYPLKKLSEKRFGDDFTYRKKMGFSVPIQNFIKNNEFEQYFRNIIVPGVKKHAIFNSDVLVRLYENISIEHYDYNEVECFWRTLTAEVWCQKFLDYRKIMGGTVSCAGGEASGMR